MSVLSSAQRATDHSPATLYAAWADPTTWPRWDSEIRAVTFDPTARRGTLIPRSGPPLAFTITRDEPDRVFTNTGRLPGARLAFEHAVTASGQGAQAVVTVSVAGPLGWLWTRILRRSMASAAPASLDGLMRHLDAA